MNPEVRRRWIAWSSQFEGRVPWMYLDIRGLVTTGVGNLIDPVEYALTLPWRWLTDAKDQYVRSPNAPATQAEIRAEWAKIKGAVSLAHDGYRAARRIASLYLDDAAIDALVLAKLESNDAVLAKQFAGWAGLPWQAVMCIHSIAWACGPGFGFPKFRAAIARRDWLGAAQECAIPGEQTNRGLIPRNSANKQLLMELANAVPSAPRVSPAGLPPPAQDTAPTVPARAAAWWQPILDSILRALKVRA